MKKQTWLAALAVAVIAAPAHAAEFRDPKTLDFSKAEQDLSAGGPVLKTVFARGGRTLMLLGGIGKGYLTDNFYLGGGGFGGVGINGAAAIGYGGFLSGYEWKLGGQNLDFSVMVGGGGGGLNLQNNQNSGGGSFVIEPGISLLRSVGGGAKVGLGASFLYFPALPDLSGPAVSLRLEFKQLSFTFPIDE